MAVCSSGWSEWLARNGGMQLCSWIVGSGFDWLVGSGEILLDELACRDVCRGRLEGRAVGRLLI